MRATTQLWDSYGEWKRLTEKEGGAILSANWGEVRRCQRAKQQLQTRIIKLTDSVKDDAPSAVEQQEIDFRIRRHVNELILLETENHSTLGRCMAQLQKERDALEETSNRLRKVHKSYVPSPLPIWNQYS